MAELRLFTRQWQQHLTVPVETFAGQDLCEVHNSSHEKITQNRQGLRSALTGTSMRDIRPVVEGVGAELAEEGETGDDDEAAVEEEPVGNPDEEAEDGEGEARESAEETLTDKPEAEGSEGEGEEVQEAPTGPTQTTYCDECGVSAFTCFHIDEPDEVVCRPEIILWALAGNAWSARATIYVTGATAAACTINTECSKSRILRMSCGSMAQ